ncbi:MAG: HdeD family acid-resistance protein [Ktedonobacteraceae bacterium]|nr:HdeD family acid-resistance protein [Ktedonobacteraceae bacterium]
MQVMTDARRSGRYWWLLVIRGLVAVLFGLAAIVWPGLTLLVLVILFGAYALVDGVVAVIVALQERSIFRRWWVLLVEGLVGVAIGVITFFWPAITALVLLYLIAVWAIVTGIFELAAAFSGRVPVATEWTLALAGILSVLLGVLLAALPRAGLLSLVWLIGAYAIVFGVLLIIRAFQFRAVSIA